ncbi:MAG: ADP-ribosylglycohydrolase family protein [Luteolibacter sp.]|uniref:ADP-ribosylglycohydrolase family protein n=1 Tax=Luteolibacter sp. TaxID=1962973 RepID=UPI003264D379
MIPTSDIVFTSLIADALALGPHWIYHQKELKKRFGHIMSYMAPATAYHTGKNAGDQTHYGDQTMLLLHSIAEFGRFDLEHYAAKWREFWENPQTISYRDGATKATLAHLHSGMPPESAASSSSELGGTVRTAPLFLLDWEDDEALFSAARSLTAFTHNDPPVVEAAEFFTRVILAVQRGAGISDALEETAALLHWEAIPTEWFAAARRSSASSASDGEALEGHGLTCHIPDAFTGVCHLLLRHPETPATALIENINAGGDSAARGMVLGMVYGAAFPVSALPASWLSDLNARDEINGLIDKIP